MNEFLLFSEALPPADFTKFLLWGIGTLIAAVGATWRLYVSAMSKIEKQSQAQIAELKEIMDERVTEKQKTIDQLLEEIRRLQNDKVKIITEIQRSLDASNNISQSILSILQNGR